MNADLELLLDEEIYRRVVLREIPAARRSVLIATALLKATMISLDRGKLLPFVALIDSLLARGVRVCLLSGEVPGRGFLRTLAEHPNVARGMDFRLCRRNHAKAVLLDVGTEDARMYLGSANLTGSGLGAKNSHRRNFEVGIFTRDHALIERVSREMTSIWQGYDRERAKPICAACELRDRCAQDHQRLGEQIQFERLQCLLSATVRPDIAPRRQSVTRKTDAGRRRSRRICA